MSIKWLTLVAGVSVIALFAILVVGLISPSMGNRETEDELSLRFPVSDGPLEGKPALRPWPDLIRASDIVAIGVAKERTEYARAPAGNPDLTAVYATYTIAVEEFLKGEGSEVLAFRKVVAYEDATAESSWYIDDEEPLAVGGRYIFALISASDGWVELAGEPFRFLLKDGLATPESTLVSLEDFDLEVVFPTKTEAETIDEILQLSVTAGAIR